MALALFAPYSALACTCSWTGPFLTVAPRAQLIVRAKVIAHTDRSRGVDRAMDVEVLEVIKGLSRARRLHIWGDNGAQCRPYVSGFVPGTEWILAVSRVNGGLEQGDYAINGCGEYWAKVENGIVAGRLTGPAPPSVNDRPESMPLSEVRTRLRAR